MAIVDYSSTGATYQGLWAHLQQPLAATTGIYRSNSTVSDLRTVRAQEGQKNLQKRKATAKTNSNTGNLIRNSITNQGNKK